MTLITRDDPTSLQDDAAITALRRAFDAQQAAFRRHRYPSRAERQAHLEALGAMMMANRHRIREALREDFAVHPALYTDLIEVVSVPTRVAYAVSQLDHWMADDEREVDPAAFGTARAYIRHQPKGVVGNIIPWNFPFDVGVGPLVEMLAAGNRVTVKPSDFTPASGQLLADMLASTFDADHVTAAVGGLELAQAFPTLPWDHLLYTGSPAVGRLVARAAAETLVPTTLELGGKCPAIVLEDAVDTKTVQSVLGTKLLKNGQMCISVDYTLVPRRQLPAFVELARAYVRDTIPDYSRSADCTGIITTRHLDRLVEMQEQARAAGYEVVELEEGGRIDRQTRQMPLSLVLDPVTSSPSCSRRSSGRSCRSSPTTPSSRHWTTSTPASGPSGSTSSATTRPRPTRCCSRRPAAGRASTCAQRKEPCPRSVSGAPASAAAAGITGLRGFASSATPAASSSAGSTTTPSCSTPVRRRTARCAGWCVRAHAAARRLRHRRR